MDPFRCPECGSPSSVFKAVSDTVLAIAAERSVEPILGKLVDDARALVGARYAAIGVPDDEGGFARFITSGMSDAQIAAIGLTNSRVSPVLSPESLVASIGTSFFSSVLTSFCSSTLVSDLPLPLTADG